MSAAPTPVDERLWQLYCTSHVHLDLPGRRVSVAGTDSAPPARHRPEAWVVLTAWNPFGHLRSKAANLAAGRHLVTALEAAGIRWHPATGAAADGSWSEDGVALRVEGRSTGLELGRRWEQLAIYEWDPGAALLSVVACFEPRITTLHAAVTDLPPPP